MLPCETCQDRLLDHSYGLLDESEAAAVDAHLATCSACALARTETVRVRGLLARASVGSFPAVKFVAPIDELVEPSGKHRALLPAATITSTWVRWVVAASFLLTAAGLGGPTARDLVGYWGTKPRVNREYAAVENAKAERNRIADSLTAAQVKSDQRFAESRKKHDSVLADWVVAEEKIQKKQAQQPFSVEVRGPTSAIPGAPNEYAIKAVGKTGLLRPVEVSARVKDTSGSFDRVADVFVHEGETVVRLAPGFWSDVKSGSDLFLFVSAKDPKTGETVDLSEPLRLLDPVYTSYLTTDKPMYRPGEVVYFRSLTLDRTRFLPPDRDTNLRFDLFGPSGQPVPGMNVIGLAKATNRNGVVLGPDGKPLRGIGVGAFNLPPNLVGGEYTLAVTEIGLNDTQPKPGTLPLATRRFLVNSYTPDRLDKKLEFDAKTYGPGDPVQVKLTVHDQAKPKSGATLTYKLECTLTGRNVAQIVVPELATFATDAAGSASARFALPNSDDLKDAILTVTVKAFGITETIVRRVPLATRKLGIEFFPEGGDLLLGVENRVYFRAATTLGKPADVSGWLTDGTRDICEVRTLTDADQPGVNQGLGAFAFTPEKGKKYALRLNKPLGTLQPAAGLNNAPVGAVLGAALVAARPGYALPAAKADGVALRVLDGVSKPGEPITVELTSVGSEPRAVLVGAYTRGRATAHKKATLEPGKPTRIALDLGTSKLGGVTRITVFEESAGREPGREDLKPIAERLVFRQSGESLQFAVTAGNAGGKAAAGAFLPGSPVQLTIAATDEAGQPKPAIVWAAVVNKSVIAMADEKTARSLPTQFLLGGEIRKSDDLEHADFLLTDHPKAAESLDLLLGTQGWRRFAEQAPDQFRNRVTVGEAEAFFVATGQRSAMPGGIRTEAQKLFDEYWPRYEAAVTDLDAAEEGNRTGASVAVEQRDLVRADSEHATKLRQFGEAIDDYEPFDKSLANRREWLPFTLIFALGLAAALLATRFLRPKGAPERRTLAIGAINFALLAAFVFSVTMATQFGDNRWRSMAPFAPRHENDPYGRYGGKRVQPPVMSPAPMPPGKTMQRPMAPTGGAQNIEIGLNLPLMNNQARLAMPPPKVPGTAPVAPGVQLPKIAQGAQGEFAFDHKPGDRFVASAQNKAVSRLQTAMQEQYTRERKDGIVLGSSTQSKILRGLTTSAPRMAPFTVREYAHKHADSSDPTRNDFTETLLWQPVIVLPQDGKATLNFDLSDSVTGYQVLVAGHSLDGRLGSSMTTIEVRKEFAADPKLPQEVSSTDKIDLPVMLTNGTDRPIAAKLAWTSPGLKGETNEPFTTVELPANRTSRTYVRLMPSISEGTVPVRFAASAGPGTDDAIERKLRIVPDGFPAQGAVAEALEERANSKLNLPKAWIPGTLKVTVTVYPNALSEVQGGLDGLLREPSGCFEQSSTANYPNVLITEYMQEAQLTRAEVAQRSRTLMDRGYAKLTGFECPKGQTGTRSGYEWFGATDRPHEALTAYGLLQFTDMARVYPVDPAMLKRTKQYLLNCRDGSGGFKSNRAAIDTFGRAPTAITNAYIVWAITESEKGSPEPSDLTKELAVLLEQSATANDPYFLALVANALLNRNQTQEGVAILQTLAKLQAKEGSIPGAATSITRSTGKALAIETTAFAVLGWLKANRAQEFTLNIASAMKWIGSQRDGSGSFGSTQSTILALKALVEHARGGKRPPESGTLRLHVGSNEIAKQQFANTTADPVVIEIAEPDKVFQSGVNDLVLETTAKQTYPVTFAWTCRTLQPNSAAECAVKLETKLDRSDVSEGESVRLNVRVLNAANKDHGMVMAIVGIPAGLKLPEDMKQLKDLTARPTDGSEPVLSYWETQGRELILYWRGMAPNQTIALGLQLIAEVPGEYRGPASRAYLYYGSEHKHWVEPLAVTIRQPK